MSIILFFMVEGNFHTWSFYSLKSWLIFRHFIANNQEKNSFFLGESRLMGHVQGFITLGDQLSDRMFMLFLAYIRVQSDFSSWLENKRCLVPLEREESMHFGFSFLANVILLSVKMLPRGEIKKQKLSIFLWNAEIMDVKVWVELLLESLLSRSMGCSPD